jgi:hypothetical protein
MSFLARTPPDAYPQDPSRLAGLGAFEREPPRVDLSSLTREQLKTLLRNLQCRDQQSLIAVVEAELFSRSGASQTADIPGYPHEAFRASPAEAPAAAHSRTKPRLLFAALGLGTVAALAVSLWGFKEQGGRERQVASLGASEARPLAPAVLDARPVSSTVATMPSRTTQPLRQAKAAAAPRARSDWGPGDTVVPTPAPPQQLARLEVPAAMPAAPPRAMVAAVDVPPPPATVAALGAGAPPPSPGAPLIVSRGAEVSLVGSPSSRPTGLMGLQSGNPLRMATAVTAASR